MSSKIEELETSRITLELNNSFSAEELKTAYRKLRGLWHPDRHGLDPQKCAEATEKSKRINISYECLSDYLDANGGSYQAPTEANKKSWVWNDFQPRRQYEGKTYTAGFADSSVTEIFLKSSHIVSTAYNRTTKTLYIKFSGNTVYRYFNVSQSAFDAFVDAPSHGKFAHQQIYPKYRQERC